MHKPLAELWKDNHGNVLLATFVGILIVGASILIYDEYRFEPVSFPSRATIRQQTADSSDAAIGDRLLIEILNAEDDSGSIMVAVFADADSFEGKANGVFRQVLEIRDGTAAVAIPLATLPNEFAISAFHDKDDSRSLNTNAIGIPTERYGFSRDARGLTGPPRYDDAVVPRPETEQLIKISLK